MSQRYQKKRVSTTSGIIELGRVLLPRGAGFLEELEKEVVTFPYGRYDDQLDALSQMLDNMKLFQPTGPQTVCISSNDLNRRKRGPLFYPYDYNRNKRFI